MWNLVVSLVLEGNGLQRYVNYQYVVPCSIICVNCNKYVILIRLIVFNLMLSWIFDIFSWIIFDFYLYDNYTFIIFIQVLKSFEGCRYFDFFV